MRKVVVNNCYGGFGLSENALYRYAETKGLTLYPEKGRFGLTIYWIVPENERPQEIEDWSLASLDERKAYNLSYKKVTLNDKDVERDDPVLVQVVEEMRESASGRFADLEIIEIPDDVEWEIQEYDGNEWIAEKHRTWEFEKQS